MRAWFALLLAAPFVVAFGGDETSPPAASPSERADPDPVYFEERVQPLLVAGCAITGCHDQPGAGRLILERTDFTGKVPPAGTAKNLPTVLQFVKFKAPMESRLVLKPLNKKDGGIPHSGNHYDFAKKSEKFRILSEWINGVELHDVPPIADAGAAVTAKVSQRVELDGEGSRERRGLPLNYEWSIVSHPDGSTPVLKAADTVRPEFRADKEGAYTLALTVNNGQLASEPDTVTVTLDALPMILQDAERFHDAQAFHTVRDTAASGGLAIEVGQECATSGGASATFDVTLPEGGSYKLFARIAARAAPAAPPPRPAAPPPRKGAKDKANAADDSTQLTFAVDGAAPVALAAPFGSGYALLPVEWGGVDGRLDAAHLTIRSGEAEVADQRLRLRGAREPALVELDARAKACVAEAQGSVDVGGSVYLVFGLGPDGSARAAGYDAALDRYVVGMWRGGTIEVEAESPAALAKDGSAEVTLKADFAVNSTTLMIGPERTLVARYGEPPASDRIGVAASGRAAIDVMRVTQDATAVAATTFDKDERAPGRFTAGNHTLVVAATSTDAPRLDEWVLVRADFATALTDAKRKETRALYFDLVGRPPLPVEQILAAGLERSVLANRLIGSLEFYEHWYEDELFFYLLLDNFRPRTPQMQALPARLANGSQDVRAATQEIVISQAFNLRNPGNDTFVSVVLEQLLDVVVQDEPKLLDAGKKMYDGYNAQVFGRQGKSQSDFVNIVLAQEAFPRVLLARAYERLFGAAPAKADLERWAKNFTADPRTFTSVVREWVESPAYAQALADRRPKTDHMFINSVFVDLLGRKPTFDEFRNFRSALQALADSRPLRAVLARVMVDSGQAAVPAKDGLDVAAFLDAQFRRFLGRAPDAYEVTTFSKALSDPQAEPRLVLLALLSSQEYQSY